MVMALPMLLAVISPKMSAPSKQVAGEKFEKIHDLFAAILEKGVSRQVKQGLYHEYVPMHEDLSVMRGKLNMGETVRLKVQNKQKLGCEFDEFSEDNLYNQILKVTIHRLIRADDVAPERKQALRRVSVFFGNVKLIQPDHAVSLLWLAPFPSISTCDAAHL